MAELTVPEEYQVGLAKLLAIPDPVFARLLSALTVAAKEKQTTSLLPSDLAPIDGIPGDELEKILDAISATHRARVYAEEPLDVFVRDVTTSMQTAGHLNIGAPRSAVNQFEERLKKFLEISTLAGAAKGEVLMYDNERTIHSLRIITDARPIFGDDVEKSPEAFAIIHTLKLSYHHGNRIEEEFFVFDEIDLDRLKDVIERAKLKSKSLRATLKKSGLNVLREE